MKETLLSPKLHIIIRDDSGFDYYDGITVLQWRVSKGFVANLTDKDFIQFQMSNVYNTIRQKVTFDNKYWTYLCRFALYRVFDQLKASISFQNYRKLSKEDATYSLPIKYSITENHPFARNFTWDFSIDLTLDEVKTLTRNQ